MINRDLSVRDFWIFGLPKVGSEEYSHIDFLESSSALKHNCWEVVDIVLAVNVNAANVGRSREVQCCNMLSYRYWEMSRSEGL